MVLRFALLALIIFSLPCIAHAIGIGVTPARFELTITLEEERNEILTIHNLSGADAEYEVYVDNYKSWFHFSETSFVLGPQDTKEIIVRIVPSFVGTYETNISVVSFLTEKRTFNTGSGIKIPVTLNVLPKPTIFGFQKKTFFWILVFVFITGLVVLLGIMKTGKRIERKIDSKK